LTLLGNRGTDPASKIANFTNEPNDAQVAGNAEAMLEIQVKSEMTSDEALDNVARFAGNEANMGEG
jgi:hypothetical protein